MKIGIYGGTFNPPHLGHITAARTAFELLKLDQLLLIPAGMPPHKDLPAGSPTPDQRLEMTRLAGEQIGLGDRVQVLDLELRRRRSFLPLTRCASCGRSIRMTNYGC
ncbi:MAG: adenylyltransferase/cytidyltransferase family protein [Oscillospiraceae bacterium]